jgi:hypothetical protein
LTQKKLEIDPRAPPLALVVWEDATQLADGPWMELVHIKEYTPHLFHQIGFVIKDLPEGVIMTEAWGEKLVANPTQIPRGMIRSIQYL